MQAGWRCEMGYATADREPTSPQVVEVSNLVDYVLPAAAAIRSQTFQNQTDTYEIRAAEVRNSTDARAGNLGGTRGGTVGVVLAPAASGQLAGGAMQVDGGAEYRFRNLAPGPAEVKANLYVYRED